MKRPASIRTGLLLGGLLWALGALLLAAAGYLPVGQGWFGVLCVLALVLMVGGALTAIVSFLPLGRLKGRLGTVRRGAADRLDGSYPEEVQPLVDDLNDLLRRNQEALVRSRLEADNLAHGLKTPLAILTNELHRQGADGKISTEEMERQVGAMAAQIELHLGRARAAAALLARPAESACDIESSVDGLGRTMRRLHQSKGIEIEIERDLAFLGDREDLEEILGNLLDNASRWARGSVRLTACRSEDRVTIAIEDDGPGLPDETRAALERGDLLDTAGGSTGVGLALSRSLAHVYGGSIAFERSSLGGLRVVVGLPGVSARSRTIAPGMEEPIQEPSLEHDAPAPLAREISRLRALIRLVRLFLGLGLLSLLLALVPAFERPALLLFGLGLGLVLAAVLLRSSQVRCPKCKNYIRFAALVRCPRCSSTLSRRAP